MRSGTVRLRSLGVCAATALALAGGAARADLAAPRVSLQTGAHYTTGDYDSGVDTDIWYVPVSAKLEWERAIVRLTVPYIRIHGPGDVVGGIDQPIVVGGAQRERERNSGLGDVVLAGTWIWDPLNWMPIVEVTGKVKFPTADEDRGLGTGEFDYSLQLDLSKPFGRFSPFVTVGYRFLGDPDDFELNDTLFASAGVGIQLTDAVSAGFAYDWYEASTDDVGDAHEIGPYVTWKIGRFRMQPYAFAGLSSGAADWGGGLQLGFEY